MFVENLNIHENFKQILKQDGIEELYPPQAEAISKGLLDGQNMVVAIPTASGKTLIAILAILKRLELSKGGKAVYLAPLRALASEKYEEISHYAKPLGYKVAVTTGDLDSKNAWLQYQDIIVATNEKFDSLIRHQVEWLNDIEIIISDEVHLINDENRGPVLEVVLSQILHKLPNCQIVALSATIRNSDEIAEWLNASLILSDWRPVSLKEGVWANGDIYYPDRTSKTAAAGSKSGYIDLAIEGVLEGGQSLVFCNTRKSVVASARNIGKKYRKYLSSDEKIILDELSTAIMRAGERTTLSEELADVVKDGVGFHHAGLHNQHRKLVESAFKERKIKVITASPTLAAGVNLPGRRVIIRTLTRYYGGMGMDYIPVLEYKQMAGRAGRPKYDEFGEAIIISKNEFEKDELLERYILADTEEIFSKFGSEPSLRMHLLSFIMNGDVYDLDTAMDMVATTFYGYQRGSEMFFVEELIINTLELLIDGKMISPEEPYHVTKFGRRVCELYLDPYSALKIKHALEDARNRKDIPAIAYLHLICSTPDVRSFYTREKDFEYLIDKAEEVSDQLFDTDSLENDVGWEFFLQFLKTAMVLESWISEASEEDIFKKFNVTSGDIYNLVNTAEWLANASFQIAKLFKLEVHYPILDSIVKRIQYGISEELVELTTLPNIGRKRARILYNNGIKSITDLKRSDPMRIAGILGSKITKSLFIYMKSDQKVVLDAIDDPIEIESDEVSEQQSIDDFF